MAKNEFLHRPAHPDNSSQIFIPAIRQVRWQPFIIPSVSRVLISERCRLTSSMDVHAFPQFRENAMPRDAASRERNVMPAAGLSTGQLNALRKFDSPTVCNAVELWNLRPRNTGYMNSSIKACFPAFPPMVGYALTSTFRSMAPPARW